MAKNPQYKVIVSDRAKLMLGSHMRFLSNVSDAASRKTLSEIMKAIRSLSVMPERFPFFSDEYMASNIYRKMYVGKQYMLLYQIEDNNVLVDYVLDCRQLLDWQFL